MIEEMVDQDADMDDVAPMQYRLSAKELGVMLQAPREQRYVYFVKRVVDWEEVWSLRDDTGWVLSGNADGKQVHPLWPFRAFAEACRGGVWGDARAVPISLDDFIDVWLPGMAADGFMAGVFPDLNLQAAVIDPMLLLDDITNELDTYE